MTKYLQTGTKSEFFRDCHFYPQSIDENILSIHTTGVMEIDFGEGEIGYEWVDNPKYADYWTVYAVYKNRKYLTIGEIKTSQQAATLKTLLQNLLHNSPSF